MKEYQYQIEQRLPLNPTEAFIYFADETKLDLLTPDWIRFKVLRKSDPSIQDKTLIDYRLTLHLIPLSWQSQITDWHPPQSFAYEQKKGPFAFFKHVHQFDKAGTGSQMTDIVTYRLKGGWLADRLIQPLVTQDLDRIFKTRAKIIETKLNTL